MWKHSVSGVRRLSEAASYFLISAALVGVAWAGSPYPQSTVLCNVTWDSLFQTGFSTTLDDGSDLWPIAWATDPNGQDVLYTSWGDGGGFGYSASNQKVSSGVGVITGSPPFSDSDVCVRLLDVNGNESANPSCFASYHSSTPTWPGPSDGKVFNLISAGGTLYSAVGTQDTNNDQILEWSTDHGVTWHQASWTFPKSSEVTSFILYGKDNANAPGGYIYGIATDNVNPGPNGVGSRNILFRVLPSQIQTFSNWQWFTGTTSSPQWTTNAPASATTVFTELNDGLVVSYLPSVAGGRYLLGNSHGLTSTTIGGTATLGVYDAPQPYGPWTSVAYYTNWLGGSTSPEAEDFTFVPKWTSGLSSWMVFSTFTQNPSDMYHDRFSLVHASLITSGSAACPGGPAGNILSGNNTGTPPSSIDNSDFNTMSASPVVVGSSAVSVTSISVWVNSADSAPNNQFQVAIYMDKGGVPGSRIAATGSQTIAAQSWNTIPITASLSANTKYWLFYNTNALHGSSNDMSYTSGTTANATWFSNAAVNFGTWPTAAPAGTEIAQQQYYIYATYAGSGGGGTLGSNTPTPPALVDNSDFNTMSGSQVTVGGTSIAVKSMTVWINSVDPSPNNQFQVAIYTDNGGVPGSLVTSTGSQTVNANSWNTVSLSANLSANTKYWLFYNTNALHGSANDMSYSTSGSARWFSNNAVTYGTWPATAPSGTLETGPYSIYVSY